MFEYLIGIVKSHSPQNIVVDVGNIGYLLIVGNPYSFVIGVQTTIFVHNYVREDINCLYGFHSKEEKDLFLSLISVSGIGPKSAISILATSAVSDVKRAIDVADAKYLMKFPGIGQKASQQIILDLKGKINLHEFDSPLNALADIEDALVALGYSKKDIKKVIPQLDRTLSQAEMLKTALRQLSR